MPAALAPPVAVTTSLAFDRDGVQCGHLRLPHATDMDAWGAIRIPVAVARRGAGPTALLVAGVHGDEHEGPIVLGEWIRGLAATRLAGTVIVLPALNAPAVRAGSRVSPLDGLDLARVFPGDPEGSPTRQIADYVTRALIPRADLVLDLHSGGASLEILTAAVMRRSADAAANRRMEAALRSLGAPLALVAAGGPGRSLVAAAVAAGKLAVAMELGSGGRVSAAALAAARTGVAGFLAHAGILPGPTSPPVSPPVSPHAGPLWRAPAPGDGVLAPGAGVFEPLLAPGDRVAAGQGVGRIHQPDRPELAPTPVAGHQAGLVIARRSPGRVADGQCLAVIARPLGAAAGEEQ